MKRKHIASTATNNVEVVRNTNLDNQMPIQTLEMDDLAKQLFGESVRPAITITSMVSNNRSADTNELSVSFQIIPAQNMDPGAAASKPLTGHTPINETNITRILQHS